MNEDVLTGLSGLPIQILLSGSNRKWFESLNINGPNAIAQSNVSLHYDNVMAMLYGVVNFSVTTLASICASWTSIIMKAIPHFNFEWNWL